MTNPFCTDPFSAPTRAVVNHDDVSGYLKSLHSLRAKSSSIVLVLNLFFNCCAVVGVQKHIGYNMCYELPQLTSRKKYCVSPDSPRARKFLTSGESGDCNSGHDGFWPGGAKALVFSNRWRRSRHLTYTCAVVGIHYSDVAIRTKFMMRSP